MGALMTVRPPEPMTTWWLLAAAVFLLILNIGMLAILTGSGAVVELAMGSMTLAVGGVLSAILQPWQWFDKD